MGSQVEANLFALIASTDDLIWSVDLDYRLIVFNRTLQENFENNFGVRIQAGQRAQEDLPPERSALWTPLYERALAEGPYRTEYPLHDGRTLELSFHPIVIDGNTTGISVFGKDITERKAAQAALEKAEQKYRAIYDGALEGMFQTTLEGNLLSANPAMALMLGYASVDELRACIRNVSVDIWDDASYREEFLQLLEPRGFFRGFECRFRRRDGSRIWVSLNCRKVCIPGQDTYLEGFIEDITERRRIVQELERSEEQFRRFFDESGSLMLFVDPVNAAIVSANKAAAGYFGLTQEQLVGALTTEITTSSPAEVADHIQLVLRRKRNIFTYRIRLASGEDRDVEVYSNPFEVRGQQLLCLVVHDITERLQAEQMLRESEERYHATFDQAAVGIVHTSIEGRFLRCNKRFADIIGYPPEEVPGMTYLQLTRPEDRAKSETIQQTLEAGITESVSWEKCYIRKDGSTAWVKLTSSPQRDRDGRILHATTIVEDINARKLAEQQVSSAQEAQRASQALYRIAFETSPDAVNISRVSDGKIADVNKSFLEITGFERGELIGRTTLQVGIWVNPSDRFTLIERLARNGECRDLELQFRRRNGEIFWARLSVSLIEIDGVQCLLSFARDISEAKLAEEEIRNLAFYDPLTNLPNRRLLSDRLRQSLATGVRINRQGALLFIDLDNFKTLNDTLGHKTGDLLLQEVARRLDASIREADTVARLGGDEFVVILEDLGETAEGAAPQARAIAEKLLVAVRDPYVLDGHACLSAASIGIAMFGGLFQSADEILQQADIAMYQAKAAGRNTIHFFVPALQSAVSARATMEEDLREAIRSRQFQVYYQPQVESGKLIGAEALVRWNHPTRGIVPPNDFIPLAEETGLILQLGSWVLETAARQIAEWSHSDSTAHITIAVNISARELRQPDFVDRVVSTLARTNANPRNLKLELTESMLVENVDDVIAKMSALKAYGLRFSLDDFGTGYSSLSYLKRLPLDQLKIDRAFVRDMLVDVASGAIAKTIISLCHAMGLSVIAEGVETEEQRAFLASHGCHSYQGFLFSKPLPFEEFRLLLPGFAEELLPTVHYLQ